MGNTDINWLRVDLFEGSYRWYWVCLLEQDKQRALIPTTFPPRLTCTRPSTALCLGDRWNTLWDRLLPRIHMVTIPIPSLSSSGLFASSDRESWVGKGYVVLTAWRQWSPRPRPFWVGSSSTLLRADLVSPRERCRMSLGQSIKVTCRNWAKYLKGTVWKDIHQQEIWNWAGGLGGCHLCFWTGAKPRWSRWVWKPDVTHVA